MEIVEFDDEMMDVYDKGDVVFLYEDDNVHLSIVKSDYKKTYAYRREGKKYGCYIPHKIDKDAFNTREASLFYNGKTDVGVLLTTEKRLF